MIVPALVALTVTTAAAAIGHVLFHLLRTILRWVQRRP